MKELRWLSIVIHVLVPNCPIPFEKLVAEVQKLPEVRGAKDVKANVKAVLLAHPCLFNNAHEEWTVTVYDGYRHGSCNGCPHSPRCTCETRQADLARKSM